MVDSTLSKPTHQCPICTIGFAALQACDYCGVATVAIEPSARDDNGCYIGPGTRGLPEEASWAIPPHAADAHDSGTVAAPRVGEPRTNNVRQEDRHGV